MKAHTPGPWKLEGNWVDGKLGGWISTLHPSPLFELIPITGTKDEIIANARLIAAAPDLLAALQECEAAEDATHDQQADAFRNARAAISKASTP